MAYTYNDFVTEANKDGMLKNFSTEDLKITQINPEYGISMLGIMRDEAAATTAEQKLLAKTAAEQLRQSYAKHAGSFQYDHEAALKKAEDAAMNPEAFSYDQESDPVWHALRKTYLREGERVAADAMARAAASSGGRNSSYAISAGQQAGNYYAAQLSDRLPALFENAYQRYLKDIDLKRDSYEYLNEGKNTAFAEWLKKYEVPEISVGQDATPGEIPGASTGAILAGAMNTQPEVMSSMVKKLQGFLGIEQTGVWDEKSAAAAGGLNLNEAWQLYQALTSNPNFGRQGAMVGAQLGGAIAAAAAGGGNTQFEGTLNQVSDEKGVLIEGRYLTWEEVARGVQNGTILELPDKATGRYSYVFAREAGKGSGVGHLSAKDLSVLHTK